MFMYNLYGGKGGGSWEGEHDGAESCKKDIFESEVLFYAHVYYDAVTL